MKTLRNGEGAPAIAKDFLQDFAKHKGCAELSLEKLRNEYEKTWKKCKVKAAKVKRP